MPQAEPPQARALPRAQIRTLGEGYRTAIEPHLLALTERDRYLRFGYPASDEQIRRYVAGLDFVRDELFGVFNSRLELVAMAHLAYIVTPGRQHLAEFGVSVSPKRRGRGYGQQLFERSVTHARNHGVSRLIIHALSENAAMLKIARKAGAAVVRDGSESEASLELPPADFSSQLGEMVAERLARTDYHLKSTLRRVRGMFKLVQRIRASVRAGRDQPEP